MDARCRTLAINEILSRIFSLNERRDNAICARVCRQWTECALDNLWEHLDQPGGGGLADLIQILSPLSVIIDDSGTRKVCSLTRSDGPIA